MPFVTAALVHEFNKRVTGNVAAVIVKPNELQSAIFRPGQAAYYEQASATKQAASLAYGIIMGHPFMDGNKRTAFWAANEHLKHLGVGPFTKAEPNWANSEAIMGVIGQAHLQVAQSKLTVEQLAEVYDRAVGQ